MGVSNESGRGHTIFRARFALSHIYGVPSVSKMAYLYISFGYNLSKYLRYLYTLARYNILDLCI